MTGQRESKEASLYIIGGERRFQNKTFSQVQVYTVHDNGQITWDREEDDAPYKVCCAASITHNKDIYLIAGGFYPTKRITDIHRVSRYNTKYPKWENITVHDKMKGDGASAFIICNHLYVTTKSNRWIFGLNLGKPESDWQRLNTKLPFVINENNPVVINQTAYIFGKSSSARSVMSWSPGDTEWKSLQDMTIERFRHCSVTDSLDQVWVLGGCSLDKCGRKGFIEQFRISENTWVQLNGAPEVYNNYSRINVCVYWKHFIFVSFCNWDYKVEVDPKFYIFNTLDGNWQLSPTPFKSDGARVIAAIVP